MVAAWLPPTTEGRPTRALRSTIYNSHRIRICLPIQPPSLYLSAMGFYATDTLELATLPRTNPERARQNSLCGQKPLRGPIHNAISGYRLYNPELGRWINRDPIWGEGGLNLFAFAVNDPVNRIDFIGNCPLIPIIYRQKDLCYGDQCNIAIARFECDSEVQPLPGISGRSGRAALLEYKAEGACRNIRVHWWDCGNQRLRHEDDHGNQLGPYERSYWCRDDSGNPSRMNPAINEASVFCAKLAYEECEDSKWVIKFI